MEQQQDTRPYGDAEVPAVIARLLADQEFLDFLGRYHSPRLAQVVPRLVRLAVNDLPEQVAPKNVVKSDGLSFLFHFSCT